MSPEQTPAFSGFNMEVPPPQVEQPKLPPPPPFSVKNRTRAQKLAKVLYGPMARVWVNRLVPLTSRPDALVGLGFGVQVGTEQGANKTILAQGETFSVALKLPTETYVKGATDYDETKKRFRAVTPFADVQEFVLDALKQFPEYQRDLEKSTEKFKKVLEKGAKQFADALKKQ
jgi:hypothetical protein